MHTKERLKAALDKIWRAARQGPEKRLESDIDRAANKYLPPEMHSLNTVQKVADWIERNGGDRA